MPTHNLPAARQQLNGIEQCVRSGLAVEEPAEKDYYFRDIEAYCSNLRTYMGVSTDPQPVEEPQPAAMQASEEAPALVRTPFVNRPGVVPVSFVGRSEEPPLESVAGMAQRLGREATALRAEQAAEQAREQMQAFLHGAPGPSRMIDWIIRDEQAAEPVGGEEL